MDECDIFPGAIEYGEKIEDLDTLRERLNTPELPMYLDPGNSGADILWGSEVGNYLADCVKKGQKATQRGYIEALYLRNGVYATYDPADYEDEEDEEDFTPDATQILEEDYETFMAKCYAIDDLVKHGRLCF